MYHSCAWHWFLDLLVSWFLGFFKLSRFLGFWVSWFRGSFLFSSRSWFLGFLVLSGSLVSCFLGFRVSWCLGFLVSSRFLCFLVSWWFGPGFFFFCWFLQGPGFLGVLFLGFFKVSWFLAFLGGQPPRDPMQHERLKQSQNKNLFSSTGHLDTWCSH